MTVSYVICSNVYFAIIEYSSSYFSLFFKKSLFEAVPEQAIRKNTNIKEKNFNLSFPNAELRRARALRADAQARCSLMTIVFSMPNSKKRYRQYA